MTAILSPCEKWYGPKLVYLFCRGEGCRARLAIAEDDPQQGHEPLSLEPGYTNSDNPAYRHGYWWRQRWKRAGMRGRATYERLKNPNILMNKMWDAERRRRYIGEYTSSRDEPLVRCYPGPGKHIVVCWECEGKTEISYARVFGSGPD